MNITDDDVKVDPDRKFFPDDMDWKDNYKYAQGRVEWEKPAESENTYMDAITKFKGLEEVKTLEESTMKILNLMQKVLIRYKIFGDLDFGKLQEEGLLTLELDKDEKPIPFTVFDDPEDTIVCIG